MTDPFARCDCGLPVDAGPSPFCSSCTSRLPKHVRDQLRAAIEKGDPIAYRTSLTKARRILKS